MRIKTMTQWTKMARSAMLTTGLLAGFLAAAPAQAGAIYSGSLDVALKVVTTQAGVDIIGDTEAMLVNTSAIGNIGTFASAALDLEPDDPTPLAQGDELTMTTILLSGFQGKAVNGPLLNQATSEVRGTGDVSVLNGSQNNVKVVFELTYALIGSVAIDNPGLDAAFLNVLFELSTLSGLSLTEEIMLDLPSGGLSDSGNFSDLVSFTLDLNAGEMDAIFLTARLLGTATSEAMSVPLPATLPLVAVALAALRLTGRRQVLRSV